MPGELGPLLMGQLLHMIFLTFFSMLIFSNTVTSLSTIYLSSDLLILMSSPLRLTNVFVSKFVQTLLYSSWMVLLFGLPIFIAFGQAQQATRPTMSGSSLLCSHSWSFLRVWACSVPCC